MASRNRKVQIVETSIERLGRILSDKWDIKVVFQHDSCFTTGKVITLPVIPDNADEDLLLAMQGYLDHEASHCVHTDFSVFDVLKGKPKLMTVFNMLEDPRIERLWVSIYPGASSNLENSAEWAYKRTAATREVDKKDATTGAISKVPERLWDNLSPLGKLLYCANVYTSNKFSDNHWFLRDVVEPAVLERVKKDFADICEKALHASDSRKVVVLAEELLQRLGEQEDPEPQAINADQIPDNALIVPEGSMPSPQQQVMQKQPEPDPNAPPVVVVRQGAQPTTAEQLATDIANTATGKYIRDAAKQALSGNDTYLVYSTADDMLEKIPAGSRSEFAQFVNKSAHTVSAMRRTLVRSLLTKKQSRWEGGKERGKVNRRDLHRIVTGTGVDVFRNKVFGQDLDVCVLMAVDHSSSMAGSKLPLAAEAATLFGEIFNQLSIPFAVFGFSTGDGYDAADRKSAASLQEQEMFKRWGNLWVGQYKGFTETWNSAGPRVVQMPNHIKHNTYDGESLKVFARMLLARKERRKILFWLNDGQPCPNMPDDRQSHYDYAGDCSKEVERMVELVAFGIKTDAVKDLYTNHVVINEIADLPKVCVSQLDKRLRDSKKSVKLTF